MSIFNININYPNLLYDSKISYKIYERCSLFITTTETIQLLNTDENIYSFLKSYSGPGKSKLVITNINSSHNNLNVKYNNNIINNLNLPLEIDISNLSDIDIIPNLLIDIDIPIQKVITSSVVNQNSTIGDELTDFNFEINNYINISFYIKDSNNQIGDTLKSSFQIKTTKCDLSSNITSTLPIISNNNGEVYYQITSTNRPLYYFVSNLPRGITCGRLTGIIEGTSNVTGITDIELKILNDNGFIIVDTTLEIINDNVNIPVITSSLTAEADIKLVYRIEATNSPDIYSFSLPIELEDQGTINEDIITINLKGVPRGVYNITITASNTEGSDSRTLQLTAM